MMRWYHPVHEKKWQRYRRPHIYNVEIRCWWPTDKVSIVSLHQPEKNPPVYRIHIYNYIQPRQYICVLPDFFVEDARIQLTLCWSHFTNDCLSLSWIGFWTLHWLFFCFQFPSRFPHPHQVSRLEQQPLSPVAKIWGPQPLLIGKT